MNGEVWMMFLNPFPVPKVTSDDVWMLSALEKFKGFLVRHRNGVIEAMPNLIENQDVQ